MTNFLNNVASSIRRMFARRKSSDSIEIDDGEAIVLQDGEQVLLRPSEIAAVDSMKVDKITYEENFLIFTLVTGRKIEIGELTKGFTNIERIVSEKLKLPTNWRTALERAPAGTMVKVWRHAEDLLPK